MGRAGAVLQRVEGNELSWEAPPDLRGYARVRARDAAGRRALCQPLFLD